MGYAIADVELTEPLPEVRLRHDQEGLALLLRAHGRPLHFSLHALDPGAQLDGGELWRLAGRSAGRALLARAIRDELAPPPAPAAADVTVAVCTRGRPALLADCLRSVLALREQRPDLPVLVVDNDPPDEATRELVASLPEVGYAREPRPGLDFARNRALHTATTEWIAYVDDDAVVDRSWLAGLEEALAENPDAGALTGLVLPRALDEDAQVVFELRGGFRRGLVKARYDGTDQPGNPLYPFGAGSFGAGANMAVRRSLALELGGFDEALDTGPPLPGGGDLDIFWRVISAGHPLVYEPAMLVFHLHRPDHASLRRQYWSWGEGFIAFLAKAHRETDAAGRVKARGLVAWWLQYAVRSVVRSLRGREIGATDLPLAELAGGLVGLTGAYRRSQRRTESIRSDHG